MSDKPSSNDLSPGASAAAHPKQVAETNSTLTPNLQENVDCATTPGKGDKDDGKVFKFSPITVIPREETVPDRSSPHTFASGYDQEWWNRMGCATTSDDDDEDHEALLQNGDEDFSSDDSFCKGQLPVARLAKRFAKQSKLIDSSDDYSSLSSYTADVDGAVSGEENGTGADSPPKRPARTKTKEHPVGEMQEDAKPVRFQKTTAQVAKSDKEQDFHTRRLQRLEERKNSEPPAMASSTVAAAAAKSPPVSNATSRSGASLAALENYDMASKKAAARPTGKAVVERRTTAVAGSNTAGASALSLQVAARNLARDKAASVRSISSADDRAARKQAGPQKPSSAAAAMQARGTRGAETPRVVASTVDRAAAKSVSNGRGENSSDDEEQGPKLAAPRKKAPPSNLQDAMALRNATRSSVVQMPEAVKRFDDRIARKMANEESSDNDKGPQLASTSKKSPPKTPPSSLQEAMAIRSTSRSSIVQMPQAVKQFDDRIARKIANGETDAEQGPKLASTIKKAPPKSPPSTLQAAMQARSQSRPDPAVPRPISASNSKDRASQKGAGVIDEDEGPQLATAAQRKNASPMSLQAAMQARTSSRSGSSVPLPMNVSQSMDTAASKMAEEEESEHDTPSLAPAKKSVPSDLKAAMEARIASRVSANPLPTSVSRAMDRAGAKMADQEEEHQGDEGPQLAASSAVQARTVSRTSNFTMPVSVSRAMDRAGAKMAEGDQSHEEQGPQLATADRGAPPSDLEAAMQSRATSRASTVALPTSISRAMDRAGAKMADDEDWGDEQGPQLATGRSRSGHEMAHVASRRTSVQDSKPVSNRSRDQDTKPSSRRSVRTPPTISEIADEPRMVPPKRGPGAVQSFERPETDKKLGEYADEDEDDHGPTLAPRNAVQANENLGADFVGENHAQFQLASQDDFSAEPMVFGEYDIERGNADDDDVIEAQAGLVVREGQAGAYAIQGIDAQSGEEDDLNFEGYDPTSSGAFVDEPEVVSAPSQPGVTAVAAAAPSIDVTPLEAELYEQEIVQAAIYEEEDDDPKVKRQLRMMQVGILCSSLAGLIFVIMSIITGFGGNDGAAPLPTIEGWSLVGGTVFGPNYEESQVFFGSSIAVTGNGKRIVAAAPGTEKDGNFNTGAVHILEEIQRVDNTTWELARSLDGPGPGEVAISSVTTSFDGSIIAAGYPFHEGGLVQIFDEVQNWETAYTLMPATNSTFDSTWFGFAVGLSRDGNFLAVGSPRDETDGLVRVYGRDDEGAWAQVGGVIRAQDSGELFGWSLSVAYDSTLRVAIGAPSHETDKGLLRVYELVGDDWSQVGDTLTGTRTLNRFGEACHLNTEGNILAVGARGSPFEAGEVKIYRELDGNWIPDEQTIRGVQPGDGFGSAVSMTPEGDTIAIGGPGNTDFGDGSGSIEVWSFDEGLWVKEGSNIGGTRLSEYGTSVSISDDGRRVVGGAPQAEYDGSVPAAGHLKVYDRDETA